MGTKRLATMDEQPAVEMHNGRRVISHADSKRGPWRYMCSANPSAPLVVVENAQEHKEMQRNLDYVWVGVDRVPLTTQYMIDREEADARIPLR